MTCLRTTQYGADVLFDRKGRHLFWPLPLDSECSELDSTNETCCEKPYSWKISINKCYGNTSLSSVFCCLKAIRKKTSKTKLSLT